VLDGVSVTVDDWGTSRTDPTDYMAHTVAAGVFDTTGGRLEPVPAERWSSIAAAAKEAQRRLYRGIAAMDRARKIDAGAYVYFTFLRPFAEMAGVADDLDWSIPRDSGDLYEVLSGIDSVPEVSTDDPLPYYWPWAAPTRRGRPRPPAGSGLGPLRRGSLIGLDVRARRSRRAGSGCPSAWSDAGPEAAARAGSGRPPRDGSAFFARPREPATSSSAWRRDLRRRARHPRVVRDGPLADVADAARASAPRLRCGPGPGPGGRRCGRRHFVPPAGWPSSPTSGPPTPSFPPPAARPVGAVPPAHGGGVRANRA